MRMRSASRLCVCSSHGGTYVPISRARDPLSTCTKNCQQFGQLQTFTSSPVMYIATKHVCFTMILASLQFLVGTDVEYLPLSSARDVCVINVDRKENVHLKQRAGDLPKAIR